MFIVHVSLSYVINFYLLTYYLVVKQWNVLSVWNDAGNVGCSQLSQLLLLLLLLLLLRMMMLGMMNVTTCTYLKARITQMRLQQQTAVHSNSLLMVSFYHSIYLTRVLCDIYLRSFIVEIVGSWFLLTEPTGNVHCMIFTAWCYISVVLANIVSSANLFCPVL